MKIKRCIKRLTAAGMAAVCSIPMTAAAEDEAPAFVRLYKDAVTEISGESGINQLEYTLLDIDRNGTPELIVKYGGGEADMRRMVFSVKDGKLIKGSAEPAPHASYIYTDPKTGELVSYSYHLEESRFSWWAYARDDLVLVGCADSDMSLTTDEALDKAGDLARLDYVSAVHYQYFFGWRSKKVIGGDTTAPTEVGIDLSLIDDYAANMAPLPEKGDLNGDGLINASDASCILVAYSLIMTGGDSGLSEAQKKAADVNGDGRTDAVDASAVLSYYAYLSTTSGNKVSLDEFLAK